LNLYIFVNIIPHIRWDFTRPGLFSS